MEECVRGVLEEQTPTACSDITGSSTLSLLSACFRKFACCTSWSTAVEHWKDTLATTVTDIATCDFGAQCSDGQTKKAAMSATMAMTKVTFVRSLPLGEDVVI